MVDRKCSDCKQVNVETLHCSECKATWKNLISRKYFVFQNLSLSSILVCYNYKCGCKVFVCCFCRKKCCNNSIFCSRNSNKSITEGFVVTFVCRLHVDHFYNHSFEMKSDNLSFWNSWNTSCKNHMYVKLINS